MVVMGERILGTGIKHGECAMAHISCMNPIKNNKHRRLILDGSVGRYDFPRWSSNVNRTGS